MCVCVGSITLHRHTQSLHSRISCSHPVCKGGGASYRSARFKLKTISQEHRSELHTDSFLSLLSSDGFTAMLTWRLPTGDTHRRPALGPESCRLCQAFCCLRYSPSRLLWFTLKALMRVAGYGKFSVSWMDDWWSADTDSTSITIPRWMLSRVIWIW